MKTLTLSLAVLFLFSLNILQAGNTLLLQNLSKVNAQWAKQPECSSIIQQAQINNPQTFNDWIATHLMLVEKTLRARDISNLSASQISNRLALLDELNGYWHSRAFPINDYTAYKTPVFIDRAGNHCAVGYLMQQSGAEGLAQRISHKQKFAYVHQIKVDGVKAWADKNGFTIDELAWIQPGYPPTTPIAAMDSGLNNTVNVIVADPTAQTIYAAGDFTAASSGTTCNHVAAWISGFAGYDWIALGDGVNGNVHAMILESSKLYVGGTFSTAGTVAANRVAVYDIALGQWQALGSLDSTVRALTFYKGELYAGGDFTGNVAKWTGTAWQVIPNNLITGSVRTFEVYNGQLVIGGNFDLATGALRKHVIGYDGSQIVIMGFGTPTPVNDFTLHQGKLYAACDVVSGTDTCALAYFDTTIGVWQVQLKGINDLSSAFSGNAIKKIISNGDKLIAAGDFFCGSGMTYGNHLMEYSQQTYDTITYDVCMPLTQTDDYINTIAIAGNQLYFGGAFVDATGGVHTNPLNHIGHLSITDNETGIETPADKISLHVYPNPFADMLRIETSTDNSISRIKILDVTGKDVYTANVSAQVSNVAVNHLAPGVYTIQAETTKGFSNTRIVKQ